MRQEIIEWYDMGRIFPPEFETYSGKILILRVGRIAAESAYINKKVITLDCLGPQGGTIVTGNVLSIAKRPNGPSRP